MEEGVITARASGFWTRRAEPLFPAAPVRRPMQKDGDALVAPGQSWTQDGTALASPLPPFPDLVPRTLPLDNRPAGNDTIRRRDYPQGLVIVQTGHEPSTTSAVLPVKASTGSEVRVTSDTYVDWPDGFVIWFLSQ